MKVCPNCGGKRFVIYPHVVQEWLVNEYGLCEDVINDFVDIVREPDDNSMWECYDCGYERKGIYFNVEE